MSEHKVKDDTHSARVIFSGFLWRSLGLDSAGETLTRVVSTGNEQNRMLAGMALVKAGQRTVGLIRKKVKQGEATPELVRLLPDLDSPAARELLEQLNSDENGIHSAVAGECIDQLDRMGQP
ncbi:MAG TPA: hypothetical protein VJ984_09590 [Xanthomonadales bacterium]|nr:hypothetical protein [Xanthomonadales bacterium]